MGLCAARRVCGYTGGFRSMGKPATVRLPECRVILCPAFQLYPPSHRRKWFQQSPLDIECQRVFCFWRRRSGQSPISTCVVIIISSLFSVPPFGQPVYGRPDRLVCVRALCARFRFLCTVDNFRLLFKIKPFGPFGPSWHLPLYLQRR